MRYIRFGLLGLLIAGGIILAVAHGISTEQVIGSVKGEKIVVATMDWNGREVIWHNRDGRNYARLLDGHGTVRLSYFGKLKIRQTAYFNGKKLRARYHENFNQIDGYDIKLGRENEGSTFVLSATPNWDVTQRQILFWKFLILKKKYLSFSYEELKPGN